MVIGRESSGIRTVSYTLYSYAAMRDLIINRGISPLKLVNNGMVWLYDDGAVTPDYVGAIPTWVNPKDPTHLKDQINRNYAHGGGWHDFKGFKATITEDFFLQIKYPGDPAYLEVARGMVYRDGLKKMDMIVMFKHSWVMVVEDGAVDYSKMIVDQKKVHIARID